MEKIEHDHSSEWLWVNKNNSKKKLSKQNTIKLEKFNKIVNR